MNHGSHYTYREPKGGRLAASQAVSIVVLLVGCAPVATGEIRIEEVLESKTEGGHSIRIRGHADLPDGSVVTASLKFAHEPEFPLDRRSERITDNRFDLTLGPHPSPCFPTRYEVSILYSPAQQPPGEPGSATAATEVRKIVWLGGNAEGETALVEEVARVTGLLEDCRARHEEALAQLARPIPGSEVDRRNLTTWIEAWRGRVVDLRRRAGQPGQRYVHSPHRRAEREIFILFNFLIERRFELQVHGGRPAADPGPLTPDLYPVHESRARRLLAFETVLLSTHRAAALQRHWFEPLQLRLGGDRTDSDPAVPPTPLDRVSRLQALEALETLAALHDTCPSVPESEEWAVASNRWFLRLTTILDDLERVPLPIGFSPWLVRLAASLLAEWNETSRSLLPPRSTDSPAPPEPATLAQTIIERFGLIDGPADELADRRDRLHEILGEIERSSDRFTPGEGFDVGEWAEWVSDLDSSLLRIAESVNRRFSSLLARSLRYSPDHEEVGRRQLRAIAKIFALEERLRAHLADDVPFPGREEMLATIRRDLGSDR